MEAFQTSFGRDLRLPLLFVAIVSFKDMYIVNFKM